METTDLKKIDSILNQKVNYERNRYTEIEKKFNEVKYRWATVIETLVANDYDVTEYYTDEELNNLLDWKSDYEIAQAQNAAAAKERFNFNQALRKTRKAR